MGKLNSIPMASKLVIILVFIFDVIAFGLAVAAEQRRSTVSFLVAKNYGVLELEVS